MDLNELVQAVQKDPKDAAARVRLGERLLADGKADDAIDHLRRAMILDRERIETWLLLGRALLACGEHVAAVATLEAGRDSAKAKGRSELQAEFEALLAGHGPVKRAGAGSMDENAFSELARATLASIADGLVASKLPVSMQRSPSILILEAKGAKMGLSEQKTPREIWCTSGMGELRFRWIATSGRWRAGGGEDLLGTVGQFLTRQLGRSVHLG
ncbi:MAG TPA: tetratricopeptide repeat protein [Planctomycetota bacterium]|nr:tetratricopeptide repeat protein [Planctomycetota bacterium]